MYGCTCARSPAYVRVRKREDERYSQEKNTPVASSRGPLRVEVIVSVRELVAVRGGISRQWWSSRPQTHSQSQAAQSTLIKHS